MVGPPRAVALTRLALRHALADLRAAQARADKSGASCVVVGLSGGADSLSLAAACCFEGPKQGFKVVVAVIDHGLQPESAQVAEEVRGRALALDPPPSQVVVQRVECDFAQGDGVEGAARRARYTALRDIAAQNGAAAILLGHTGDDQAEQVFLGLLRGSGTRSLAGMRVRRDDLVRPYLEGPPQVPGGPIMRADTLAACEALGLDVWHDPANADRSFARVRVREALDGLESDSELPGLKQSLVRTAASAGRDADFLDRQSDVALAALGTPSSSLPQSWPAAALADLDPAIRIRVLRKILVAAGALDGELASFHLLHVEQLLTCWRGQGPIHVPGVVEVARRGSLLFVQPQSPPVAQAKRVAR